jgi:hypothetical protein
LGFAVSALLPMKAPSQPAEDKIGSEYRRSAFLAVRDDLEQEIDLLAARR